MLISLVLELPLLLLFNVVLFIVNESINNIIDSQYNTLIFIN